jgi:hypothetical protein
MNSPEECVSRFIVDYFSWESVANKREENGEDPFLGIAEAEYAELIKQYCSSGVEPQDVAVGDPPAHHPDSEKIIEVEQHSQSAKVITSYADSLDLITEYHYLLIVEEERWKISSLLFDDDGELLETL